MNIKYILQRFLVLRCPNCRRETARTEDWACQWCGYPLLSGSYKKIPKNYKQLKEERQGKLELSATEESLVPPVLNSTTLSGRPTSESVDEPITEHEDEPTPALESKAISKPKAELEPEQESESSQTTAIIDMTLDELISAYKADEAAANVRFMNKILKLTGVVNRIEVNDYLDSSYLIITSPEKELLQTARCYFDKKRDPELSQLTTDQMVTVQGKFDGSMINIRLNDCVLVY